MKSWFGANARFHRIAAISAWHDQNKTDRGLEFAYLSDPGPRQFMCFHALNREIIGVKYSHIDSFEEAIHKNITCVNANDTNSAVLRPPKR